MRCCLPPLNLAVKGHDGYVKPKLIIMKLKKLLPGLFIALAAISVGSSAMLPLDVDGGLQEGNVMPRMKSRATDLSGLAPRRGSHRYHLVHFWAAYDNASRAENVQWSRFFGATLSDKIGYNAISLDKYREVFEGTLALDCIEDTSNQIWVAAHDADEVTDLFGLKNGFHTYLIDDRGKVRAVDPTPNQLNYFYLN